MTTTSLTRIDEVLPRTGEDDACINEVRDVLKRHGALDRFGLVLLHSHFELDEDEVLVESVDLADRTMTIQPVRLDDHRSMRTLETQWILETDQPVMTCVQYCQVVETQGHFHRHVNADPVRHY